MPPRRIEVKNLAVGVHARVGASAPVDAHRLFENLRKPRLDHILERVAPGLTLPAGKVPAIIRAYALPPARVVVFLLSCHCAEVARRRRACPKCFQFMQPTPYRHIIWDWNGTLLDDLDVCIEVMNAILARRRLSALTRARYHTLFDFPVRNYYERLGFDPRIDGFEQLSVEFIAGYEARRLDATLHPESRSILGAVHAAGCRQSILSAYRHETLHEIVAHFGLTAYFEHIVGLDNIHAHSKVALGRDLVRRLAVPPAAILLIGDTLHDLEVARELGVDCALVAAGHHPIERLTAGHSRVFPDLAALANAYGLQGPSTSGGGKI